jgi:AAA+ superfamily predicted ATPase
LSVLPEWASEMRKLFRAGTCSQFVLYGAVHDLVALDLPGADRPEYVSLRRFLTEGMFAPFDVVLHYDRGRGIRVKKGGPHFHRFLEAFDSFQGTDWARLPAGAVGETLDLANTLPRDAVRALELLNRFLRGSQALTARDGSGALRSTPLKVAVVIDYAQFVAPRADALQASAEHSQVLIQLLDWASDPLLVSAHVATVLLTETLGDLHRSLVESPYNAKLRVDLPTTDEIRRFVADLVRAEPDFERLCPLSPEALSAKLLGLSRVNVRSLVLRALRNDEELSHDLLSRLRKELIEKQATGLIEFVESERTLDDVAGHREAKAWMREDAELMRRGRVRAVPMGYLLAGRIGTGKTYLVTCLAGEVGVPVVELKNFRDKWVGATEGNLERIFAILQALGQVIVFVDEADQATGKRGGGDTDGGLSGRVYGMLAKEMSDTRNRGKILWIFATSRPDLLEVDLKRQGRLDVHIPLFPPQDGESRHELFKAMAGKVGLRFGEGDGELPELPDDHQLGGNEMEGILVRAMRKFETRDAADQTTLEQIVASVIEDFRPSAHVERLELMDLLAAKECTDERFLPERFRAMGLGHINARIEHLKAVLGER